MKYTIPKDDINKKIFMKQSPDFNRPHTMMQTDKVYECEITAIVQLTETEKLFHLKILDCLMFQWPFFVPCHQLHNYLMCNFLH